MKRWILVLALAMNTSYCGQKNNSSHISNDKPSTKLTSKITPVKSKESDLRGLASVAGSNSEKPDYKKIIGQYPSSFKSFMNGETQRVKLLPTIKQYANILPEASFNRMLELAKKVDDRGFSIERQNSELILKNSKATFKASFTGEIGDLQTTIEGQTFDFSDDAVLTRYLDNLEKKHNLIQPSFKFWLWIFKAVSNPTTSIYGL